MRFCIFFTASGPAVLETPSSLGLVSTLVTGLLVSFGVLISFSVPGFPSFPPAGRSVVSLTLATRGALGFVAPLVGVAAGLLGTGTLAPLGVLTGLGSFVLSSKGNSVCFAATLNPAFLRFSIGAFIFALALAFNNILPIFCWSSGFVIFKPSNCLYMPDCVLNPNFCNVASSNTSLCVASGAGAFSTAGAGPFGLKPGSVLCTGGPDGPLACFSFTPILFSAIDIADLISTARFISSVSLGVNLVSKPALVSSA